VWYFTNSGLCKQVANEGNELIVFYKCALLALVCPKTIETLSERIFDDRSIQHLPGLTKNHNISVVAGVVELADDGNFYNTYIVAMSSGTIVSLRKIYSFISQHIVSEDANTVYELPNGVKAGI